MTITTTITTDELAAWLADQHWSDFAQSLARFYQAKGFLSPKQENAARSMFAKVQARNAEKAVSTPDPEIGFYLHDSRIYRVQMSKAGRPYAKAMGLDGEWQYDGRANFANLTETAKMTLDEAKAWGLAHGRCLVCSRELTDPVSVEQGIGPVCIKRFAE